MRFFITIILIVFSVLFTGIGQYEDAHFTLFAGGLIGGIGISLIATSLEP